MKESLFKGSVLWESKTHRDEKRLEPRHLTEGRSDHSRVRTVVSVDLT